SGLGDDAVEWREVSSTSEQCRGRACAHYERCHVTQMRRQAQTAELVIVNHHLYFADLTLRARMPDAQVTLLPEHDVVVFDEAHELDDVAAQHFGVQVSEHRIHELLHDIARAVRPEPAIVARFSRIAAEIELRSRELFDALPYEDGRGRMSRGYGEEVLACRERLDTLLAALENELVASSLDDRGPLARRAMNIAGELAFCVGDVARASLVAENEDAPAETPFVRYTEMNGRTRALVARPIDVADLFASHLKAPTAVFVSATLRVGDSFGHYRDRLGLNDAHELAVGSPFDYGNNAALYIPNDLPEPDAPDFVERATARITELVNASGGGTFVLCTSHRMLQIVRARLASDTLVLVQGDSPKAELIERFRQDGNAVLLGTMTFWSGVDVAGRALRSVIIDKLPFASPSDPLVAARVAHMKSRGEDAFRGYQLPQAALLLRQGFGRLIRRGDDRGMVTILDRRITQKSYGRVFLRSLPPCPRFSDWQPAADFLETL
ncbi:MAG TPA: ATP-dependent DNA helicase, partial [Myxococcota bacterium]|nr:ATP-dependent DNA helicase [Myxococcota bacterium]